MIVAVCRLDEMNEICGAESMFAMLFATTRRGFCFEKEKFGS